MDHLFVYLLGFLAQGFFSARMLVQWIQSEKAGRVLSPALFWQLSLGGSFLLIIYAVMRMDVVIAGGQIALYYIYLRNLALKRTFLHKFGWGKVLVLMSIPPAAALWLLFCIDGGYRLLMTPEHIPLLLLIWGTAAQLIFLLRFVYQWFFSERQKLSVFPLGFWIISLFGALMLTAYAGIRRDPVIFLGQLCGIFVYFRNILLHYKYAASCYE